MSGRTSLKKLCLLLITLAMTSSCSWLERVERDLVSDSKPKKSSTKYIPKEQYDQLLAKYEDLNRQMNEMKESQNSQSLVNDLQKTPLASEINKNPETPMISNADMIPTVEPISELSPQDTESALNRFHQAISLRGTKPAEALRLFQSLEHQGPLALRARSKFHIGEMFLQQSEYDLALQSFEDVITKNAYSGVVIDALKGAIACTQKLGLKEKQDQYQSLLKDVFGSEI